jgi:hypothetical protein
VAEADHPVRRRAIAIGVVRIVGLGRLERVGIDDVLLIEMAGFIAGLTVQDRRNRAAQHEG